MEVFLIICAVGYFISNAKVSTAAYNAGKEPPSVAKARLRSETGPAAPKAPRQRKEPGAFASAVGARWRNACAASLDRGERKAARRQAWRDENGPTKDARWRDNQQRRQDRLNRVLDKWAGKRGLPTRAERPAATTVRPAPTRPVRTPTPPPEPARQTQDDENRSRRYATVNDAMDAFDNAPTDRERDAVRQGALDSGFTGLGATLGAPEEHQSQWARAAVNARHAGGASTIPDLDAITGRTANDSATGGTPTMYEQAVAQLIRSADQVNAYQQNLTAFAGDLEAKGWGAEVHGPIGDMHSRLASLEGMYRDLAARMSSQGDAGRAAYDRAPWVPGPDAVTA